MSFPVYSSLFELKLQDVGTEEFATVNPADSGFTMVIREIIILLPFAVASGFNGQVGIKAYPDGTFWPLFVYQEAVVGSAANFQFFDRLVIPPGFGLYVLDETTEDGPLTIYASGYWLTGVSPYDFG